MIRRAFQLASTLARAIRTRVAFYWRYDYAKLMMRGYPLIGPTGYADLLGLIAELSDPKRAMPLGDVKWAAFCLAVKRSAHNQRRLAEAHLTEGPLTTARAMDVAEGSDRG